MQRKKEIDAPIFWGVRFYYLLADGQLLLYVADAVSLSMSPVSPVFNTEVTVSIGLKTNFRMGTFIPQV